MFTDNRAIVSEMQERLKREKYTGEFSISEGKVHGSLYLNGKDSFVKLCSNESFSIRDSGEIKGLVDFNLHRDEPFEFKRVSLLGLFFPNGPMSGTYYSRYLEDVPHTLKISFRYAIIGDDKHITQDEKTITEVRFLLDDSAFFKDYKTFGSAFVYPLTEQDKVDFERMANCSSKINFGEHLQFAFFSGANEIVSIETEWGTISFRHNINFMCRGKFNSVGIENLPFNFFKI